ncbi:hypothetical protein ABZW03_05945 [Kitasatospora sp. NPDC004799]|uniref:hypothetical protein n=1 Tax=Kitasatospora sp. NPDC004799 TaxID=3154460 RepID=UPI0033A9078A
MRVHRSAHVRNFTVLPNTLLQDRRLTFTARGLLADLLSRPDGRREDGRHMADTSPQGRGAVRRALKELTQAGYYRVDVVRMPDGTVRSEAHVYDTPQPPAPGLPRPAPGEPAIGPAGTPPIKNRHQETSHPARQTDEPAADTGEASDRPGEPEEAPRTGQASPALPDGQIREAVATLLRVIRPEPRLHLGEAEARELAPLVTPWLQRGATTADLAQALLHGLPTPLHSPVGVLRHRLRHKLPPAPAPQQAPGPRYAECAECHDPLPQPGICTGCAGLGRPRPKPLAGGATSVATTGAARAREALRTRTRPPAGPRATRPFCPA